METLTFFNPATQTAVTTLALGSVGTKSSDDIALRIVNNSDIYQAADVTVTAGGDDDIQLWLSTDGDTFGPAITVGDIQPGGLSQTFWLRRVTGSDVNQGPHSATLSAVPALWTSAADTSVSGNDGLDTGDN